MIASDVKLMTLLVYWLGEPVRFSRPVHGGSLEALQVTRPEVEGLETC
jgi:hypothetical protein